MATVTLDRAFLSLAATPSVYVAAFTAERSEQLAVPGEVRRMANGRLRTVRRAGSATTLGVSFPNLTAAQVQTFRDWTGSTVLFRDAWGRRMYGVYFAVDVKDRTDRGGHHVKIALSQVTVSDAV